jgi:hypothetical protein
VKYESEKNVKVKSSQSSMKINFKVIVLGTLHTGDAHLVKL